METFQIIGAVVLFTVLLVGGIFSVIFLVWKKFQKASGFSKLAEMFPSSYKPEGRDFPLSTIAIGSVRYRNCVYITVASEGLYIKLRSVFPFLPKDPPLLIPWARMKEGGETKVYMRTAYRLDVGEPKVASISILVEVYRAALPYLTKG
jgi:hypothetical protein